MCRHACSAWPKQSCRFVFSSRYSSVVVFGLPCLSLHLSFLSCPSLQTRVTLLRQMAFCLAELHLWSTKSSLQVKGTTYHHVQSSTLLIKSLLVFFLFLLSLSCSGYFCQRSLCFHTSFPPVSTSPIWLSDNINSHLFCFHFLVQSMHYTWHFKLYLCIFTQAAKYSNHEISVWWLKMCFSF